MAYIRPLLLSARSRAWRVLFARSIAAIILLLPATEMWAGEHAARHLAAMSLAGQVDGREPATANILRDEASRVQMVANYQAPLGYFLDELPADFDISKASNEAKDVAIVRVRVRQAPTWLGQRDQSGVGSTELPRDRFFARIRVVEIRNGSGSVVVGNDYNIYFGDPSRELVFPITRAQLARDYMVAMYLDTLDAKHRLIGFPVSGAQYSNWRAEVSEYERSQYKK